MTPAVEAVRRAGIAFTVHEYEHDPAAASYGLEAAAKTGVESARVFKTLVAAAPGGALAVAVLPVDRQLDLKAFARALGAKKMAMADAAEVERVTGYVLGGISPIGQKKSLPTVIDSSARDYPTIFVSGGRRGLEIELAAGDLQALTRADFAAIGK